ITGGSDIDPSFFRESPHIKLGKINPYRDEFEIELARSAIDNKVPLLGVCRGAQIINVAMGGSLYQDIESQLDKSLICHRQKAPNWYGIHEVTVSKDSRILQVIES